MPEFEESLIEVFPMDGLMVPVIRLTLEDLPPHSEILVGGKSYKYDRSYPDKGYSAVLPAYLREQMGAGKTPLLIERPSRLFVYFAG